MLKETFKKFRSGFTKLKIYIQRVTSWLVIVNAMMISTLFIDRFTGAFNKLFNTTMDLSSYIVIIYIGGTIAIIIFGWLDVKYGFMSAEQNTTYENVPQIREMRADLKEIKELLKNVNKNLPPKD